MHWLGPKILSTIISFTTIISSNHPFSLRCPYVQTTTNLTMAFYKKQNKIPLNGTTVNGAHLEKNWGKKWSTIQVHRPFYMTFIRSTYQSARFESTRKAFSDFENKL
ncbi:hypothetical protein CDAR_220991 [Caerostris darwini]|uniref:Uncharacterized protein n=1 Tax=Caerostris darwini TaxID=1538125 RepID=A0AAV4P3L2_9ARAC|nr:hypothetical protein CDAR_220991 [Caerostris darwini]